MIDLKSLIPELNAAEDHLGSIANALRLGSLHDDDNHDDVIYIMSTVETAKMLLDKIEQMIRDSGEPLINVINMLDDEDHL